MKKKKLKKKIKQLKRQLDSLKTRHHNVALKVSSLQELKENMEDTIDHLDELVADIENKPNDNRINILWEWLQRSGIDFHDWGKTPTYAEEVVYYGAEGQVIKFKEDPKNKITCDSCDYHGLSGCGTQCAECPANNKKEGDINAN